MRVCGRRGQGRGRRDPDSPRHTTRRSSRRAPHSLTIRCGSRVRVCGWGACKEGTGAGHRRRGHSRPPPRPPPALHPPSDPPTPGSAATLPTPPPLTHTTHPGHFPFPPSHLLVLLEAVLPAGAQRDELQHQHHGATWRAGQQAGGQQREGMVGGGAREEKTVSNGTCQGVPRAARPAGRQAGKTHRGHADAS